MEKEQQQQGYEEMLKSAVIIPEYKQTLGKIKCCLCGEEIIPNASALCSKCLAANVDITLGISNREVLNQCKECLKWETAKGSAGTRWLQAEMESVELLSLCVHRIKGLGRGSSDAKETKSSAGTRGKSAGHAKKTKKDRTSDHVLVVEGSKPRLIDSKFIWTEPHSRRLKVQVVIERDVQTNSGGDMPIRQSLEVEFVIKTQVCPHCAKAEMGQDWKAVVQLRQNVDHKKTFYFLEQLILQRQAAANALNIVIVGNGIDVFFAKVDHANKFTDFVCSVVPAKRLEVSKQLQSSDLSSNVYNFRTALSVEIVPICKHDLVLLPHMLQATLYGGGKSTLLICTRVAGVVHLVDINTGNTAELRQAKYFQYPFRPIASIHQLSEFVILDTKVEGDPYQVECARSVDFGVNDLRFRASVKHFTPDVLETLVAGDILKGYDLEHSNFITSEHKELLDSRKEIPPVVLVYRPHLKKEKEVKGKVAKVKKANNGGGQKLGPDEITAPTSAYGITEDDVESVLQDLTEMGVSDGNDIANVLKKANTKR